jgi:hypothetical protein
MKKDLCVNESSQLLKAYLHIRFQGTILHEASSF